MTSTARECASSNQHHFRIKVRLQHSMCERIKNQISLQGETVGTALLEFAERALDTPQEQERFKAYVADTLWRYEAGDFKTSGQFLLSEVTSSVLLFLSYSVGLENKTDFAAAALIELYVLDAQIDSAVRQYLKKSGESWPGVSPLRRLDSA
jgi:hypothetical protein